MPAVQTRNVCFTINNPPLVADVDEEGDVVLVLPTLPHERYVVWQLEEGEQNTLHVQGYAEFSRGVTWAGINRALTDADWPAAHCEARMGNRDQAREYCMKEDTRVAGPWERGTFSNQQGKRNDLESACAVLRQTKSLKATAEAFPAVFVRCHKGLSALQDILGLEDVPSDADFIPRPWQQKIIDLVSVPPNDRNIIWVVDNAGNNGKSRLARHLVCEHEAIILEGRLQDMAYGYNKQPIVVIDVTRAAAENLTHLCSFAEKLKNGMLYSTKYEPKQKLFKPPHVVFFANVPPPLDVWTPDRVLIRDLADPSFLAAVPVPAEDPFGAGFA